ncbi:MAG: HPF/RaiA family ribosome-associated protein [Candidatus Polarisedimenticolaceae bacterium]|nr:HPF/RaiA family ribosome-associated protein [Candidatus Polarisedimenticolaceae bacterium]
MKIPLQVTFRNMQPTKAVEARIREKVAKLERLYDEITSCYVVVEEPHNHHRKGRLFQVRVDLTLPHGEIVASRHPGRHLAHQDLYVAIRDAFRVTTRQLVDYLHRDPHKVRGASSHAA